jgi:hypothetical protein
MNYNCWKALIKKDAKFSMEYIKMLHLEDEALMALCYKYLDPLCQKLWYYSNAQNESEVLMYLFNHPDLKIKLERNNNITFYN